MKSSVGSKENLRFVCYAFSLISLLSLWHNIKIFLLIKDSPRLILSGEIGMIETNLLIFILIMMIYIIIFSMHNGILYRMAWALYMANELAIFVSNKAVIRGDFKNAIPLNILGTVLVAASIACFYLCARTADKADLPDKEET